MILCDEESFCDWPSSVADKPTSVEDREKKTRNQVLRPYGTAENETRTWSGELRRWLS